MASESPWSYFRARESLQSVKQPELKDFSGYVKLVNNRDNANQIITMLSNTPHSAALVFCPGHELRSFIMSIMT
jgi:hypothetical protein